MHVPEAIKVAVVPFVPETVQTLVVAEVNVTARPELAVPTKVSGVATVWVPGLAKVMVCVAAFTVSVYAWDTAGSPKVSERLTVNGYVPETVAVPAITPVVGAKVIPVGNAPAVIAYVSGAMPPGVPAATEPVYAVPAVAVGADKEDAKANDAAGVMVMLNPEAVIAGRGGVPESVTVNAMPVKVPVQAKLGAVPEVVVSVPEVLSVRQDGRPVADQWYGVMPPLTAAFKLTE